MTLLYENYAYQVQDTVNLKTQYWLNWRFDKLWFKPGGHGLASLWLENHGMHPIYVSKIGAQFDWQADNWYVNDSNVYIPPNSSKYLSFLDFNVPTNIVGKRTCQFGVEIHEKDPMLDWRNKGIIWFEPTSINVTVIPRYRCFVSRSNREENKLMVEPFVNRIQDWGFDTYTVGINVFADLGKEKEVIRAEIEKADCLIGIATKRYQAWVNGYAWKTLEWLHDEVSIAYGLRKPILIIKEEDLELGGLPTKLSFISFSPHNINEGLRKLDNCMLQFRRQIESKKSGELFGNLGKLAVGALLLFAGIGIGRRFLAP